MAFLSILLLLCAFPLSNAVGRLRTFNILDETKNISEALNFCKRNYTNLVTVYDEEDNTELYKLISNSNISIPKSPFIGAHTNKTNYTSKWSNGDDVTFTKLNETCGGICGAAFRANGSWELLPYSTTIYFICYKEGVGQQPHNHSLISLKKNWTEAQLHCRTNYTDLVSIRNEKENERLKNMVNDSAFPFWIGLLYDNIEWFDGGQSAYRNYLIIPKQSMLTILSLSGSTTSWGTVALTNSNKVLCYKSFIHVSSDKMSWEEALDYCNSNASGLLRIESENDQIETERELRRQKISGPVWIGLRQSRLFGFWIWVSGLQVGPWTNWKGGRQPEHQKSLNCGAIEKVNGVFKWSNRDCRSTFRVLCEGSNSPTSPNSVT